MEKISSEEYELTHDETENTVKIKGSLRLNGVGAYQPTLDALMSACDSGGKMTLDLRELEFLNSSGIATLSKFVLHVRGREAAELKVVGSKSIPWQGKSLVNLARLMPSLELDLV